MQAEEIKRLIEKGIPGARVEVSGDGDHFEAVVVSERFEGQSMVQRHRAVYQTLGDLMQGAIHALALKTYTPAQHDARRAGS